MSADNRTASLRMLVLITMPKLAQKTTSLFSEGRIPIQYQFRAQGTASSEIMDILGLGSIEKTISFTMLPKAFADDMLKKIQKRLGLGAPNSGIAFTLAISGSSSPLLKMIEGLRTEPEQIPLESEVSEVQDSEYAMIMAIVNQGFSEAVMDAAKPSGAGGGTVFHSRRVGDEETMKFWGISVQQEKEIVIILAKTENKMTIMQSIGEKCGMRSDAHGIVFSLPVDAVVGLNS